MNNMFDISGKKAIVTGGTRGLGYSMAEGLMENGVEVVIWGTNEKVLQVAGKFNERGYKCYGEIVNLMSREELKKGFERSIKVLGDDLDILVCAAGIQRRHPSEEFPLSEWDEVIRVNLTSVFELNQLAARVMLPKKYGKIINIASMASFFGGFTVPAYAASKGGIAQMTKTVANEWAGRGINVNAIAPGYMATEMTMALLNPTNPRHKEISDRIPAGRWGTGNDMKGCCVFLSSHASDYLDGTIIPVDGGYLVK